MIWISSFWLTGRNSMHNIRPTPLTYLGSLKHAQPCTFVVLLGVEKMPQPIPSLACLCGLLRSMLSQWEAMQLLGWIGHVQLDWCAGPRCLYSLEPCTAQLALPNTIQSHQCCLFERGEGMSLTMPQASVQQIPHICPVSYPLINSSLKLSDIPEWYQTTKLQPSSGNWACRNRTVLSVSFLELQYIRNCEIFLSIHSWLLILAIKGSRNAMSKQLFKVCFMMHTARWILGWSFDLCITVVLCDNPTMQRMSSRTLGHSVADVRKIGTFLPKAACTWSSPRYDILNSWPHWLTQCASSMQTQLIFFWNLWSNHRVMNHELITDSGDMTRVQKAIHSICCSHRFFLQGIDLHISCNIPSQHLDVCQAIQLLSTCLENPSERTHLQSAGPETWEVWQWLQGPSLTSLEAKM